jgi:hypothetical protein
MRTSMAYFAGAGTIVVAIAAGLGGGLTIANVLNPHKETRDISKLEQRMSAKPIPPSAEADQSAVQANNTQTDAQANRPQVDQPKAPVPYVAATGAAITANAPAAPSDAPKQAAAPAPQASPQPVEASVTNDQPAKPAEPQAKPQAAPREQASSSPEDANAKARDSDLKRLAAEKRKADRRQQWADKKKAQQQREAELSGVEASVRRDSDGPRVVRRDPDGPRVVVRQDDDDSGPRSDFDRRSDRGDRPFGLPIFNLFGGDRD